MVREMDAIRPDLPADVFDIDVMKFSPSDVNIIQVALMSETTPYKDLGRVEQETERTFGKIKSLKNVDNWAFPQQQVRIS
jgi:multidrug efflux pump subunit AcrB